MNRKSVWLVLASIMFVALSCGKQDKQTKKQEQSGQTDIVDQVLLRLERDMYWAEESFGGIPRNLSGNSLYEIVTRGQLRVAEMSFRDALGEYKSAFRLYPDIADPHWGLAVAYYYLALADMLSRGRCQLDNVRLEEFPHLLNSQPYLAREVIVIARAGLSFRSVEMFLKQNGYDKEQLLYSLAYAHSHLGGMLPSMLEALKQARSTLEALKQARSTGLIHVLPVADFQPDGNSLAILKLAQNEFKKAERCLNRAKYARGVVLFLPNEMMACHSRVDELISLNRNQSQ